MKIVKIGEKTQSPGRRIFRCQRVPLTWKYDSTQPLNSRINYVIAVWSGKRRGGVADDTYFLNKHLISLKNRSHELKQITISIAHNPEESPRFKRYIDNLAKEIAGVPVKIIRRPNDGLSYGAFVDAFYLYGSHFDHYIFVEDDYVFCKNDFDKILLQMFSASPHCGYLASLIGKARNEEECKPHIIIPNGITSTKNLQSIKKRLGRIPFAEGITDIVKYSSLPKMSFSYPFLDIKKWLYDIQSHFSVPIDDGGQLVKQGSSSLDPLLLPTQHY